jgi:hypothetical protein
MSQFTTEPMDNTARVMHPATMVTAPNAGYVAVCTGIAAAAMADPNHPSTTLLVLSMALCLPALIGTLPVLYVVVSIAWNVTDADHGGTSWPVTASFAAVIALAAVVNVVLLRSLLTSRRRRVAA